MADHNENEYKSFDCTTEVTLVFSVIRICVCGIYIYIVYQLRNFLGKVFQMEFKIGTTKYCSTVLTSTNFFGGSFK